MTEVPKSSSVENVAGTSDVVFPSVAGTKEMIDTHAASVSVGQWQEQQPSGTTGPTYTTGAWRTVAINTEVSDTGGIGAIVSDQLTGLVAGTYEVIARATTGTITTYATARLRIYNVTGTAALVQGVNTPISNTDGTMGNVVPLAGVFTLSGTSTIELQLNTNQNLSSPAPAITTGDVEVYSNLYLRKIT